MFALPSRTRQPKLYRAVQLLYHVGWASTPSTWQLTRDGLIIGRLNVRRGGLAYVLRERVPRDGYNWPAKDVIERARREGISERTLQEARKMCLAPDRRVGFGPGSRVMWCPPQREFVRWVPWKPIAKYLREERRAGRPSVPPWSHPGVQTSVTAHPSSATEGSLCASPATTLGKGAAGRGS